MNIRQLEMALIDTCATFCIGALGGLSAKSFSEPWQKVAVILSSGVVEGIYFSPSIGSYCDSAPEEGLCRKVVTFGCRLALPTVSFCAGLLIGAGTQLLEPGRIAAIRL